VAISVLDDRQWKDLVQALGSPPWALDPELRHLEGRLARAGELDQRLAEWTGPRQAQEIMTLLQARRVPAGVANDGRDLGQDPQLVFERYYTRREHPVMGEVHYAAHSLEFSASPQRVDRSPCLGEHTREICLGLLGLDQDEYQRLEQQGVFR
jgi:crotonobetainyl-CoA:carnitine CoA-transferase CaiB-like acyl-CoA transferase